MATNNLDSVPKDDRLESQSYGRKQQIGGSQIGEQTRMALKSYRSDPALSTVLTDTFLDRMATFGTTLALWGTRTNLTAQPEDPADIGFHIVDSLMPLILARSSSSVIERADERSESLQALSATFLRGRRVLDFGSGAGFPGLILACASEAHFTLAESRKKRASFLKVATAEMGLANVEVIATRLSATSVSPAFDAVVSRASGPPASFYQTAAHALIPGGLAILYSSPSQRLLLNTAKDCGLGGYQRFSYTVRRGRATVERSLAIWRKSEKVP
jgi:16S rRNA (guanine(527)-N(7))-methyltransferase RsmG